MSPPRKFDDEGRQDRDDNAERKDVEDDGDEDEDECRAPGDSCGPWGLTSRLANIQ